MANLTQIVYLTKADYEALLADTHDPKQYTKNGKTIYYDENALYITPETVTMEELSGTLPVSKGGTGASSFTSGQLLVGNGTNAVSTKAISGSIINDANTIPTTQAVYNNTLLKSGGTMTGVFTAKASQYDDSITSSTSHAINMNNSNIIGLNAIYTADASDSAAEGINFMRDATHFDTLWMSGGDLLFVPNRTLGTSTTKADSQKVGRFTTNPTTNQVVITDGTTGGMKSSGYTIAKSVPSDAKFTDTTALTSMTGTLAIDHGGTGATSAADARTNLGLGSVSNNTALNSSTGTKGDIIYWSAANTPARLGANTTTTPKYLCMTSSAPVWQEIIPTSNLDLTAITTAEIDTIITGNSSGTLTVPTKTSQLTNDSNFLVNTNNVINLNSYGAAIGMTSTSTSSAKKFEVNSNYTSYLNGPVNVAGVATFSGGIKGVTNYTTGEVLTGGTWIDGKPLYRRTYVFDAAGSIDLSDLNYDFIHIIDMVANTKYSNANDIWTGTYYWGSTSDRLHIYIDQDGLKLRFGTNVTLYRGAWVTVEYTKATT